MNDNIIERSGGIGSNWHMTLQRKDLPHYKGRYDTLTTTVSVDGTRHHYAGGCTWSVDLTLAIPPDRNRQPKPDRYLLRDEARADRIEHVTRNISKHNNKRDAVAAAYKLICEIDLGAMLDKVIEDMWDAEYRKDCNSYLHLGADTKELREARVEKIRAMRKADPEFAELFPEPPNKMDY